MLVSWLVGFPACQALLGYLRPNLFTSNYKVLSNYSYLIIEIIIIIIILIIMIIISK